MPAVSEGRRDRLIEVHATQLHAAQYGSHVDTEERQLLLTQKGGNHSPHALTFDPTVAVLGTHEIVQAVLV